MKLFLAVFWQIFKCLHKSSLYSEFFSICLYLSSPQGPKSSFITPEKRAKLRSNPVKVHFAEEVEVNGNSQVRI